ncbi:MAG: proteasome assembly chaperone family protein [Candidatus Hodarchaeota archaeon]
MVEMIEQEKTEIKKCCHSFFPAEDAVMIVGVANAGLCGSIAANHIIEQLGLREIAYLYSSLFPPISVFLDGILKHPFRIYGGPKGKPSKIFVATTELPLNKAGFHEIAHKLIEFTEEIGVTKVVTLVGFPVQQVDKYDVFFAAEPEIFDKLEKIEGIQPLPKGMIYGIEALILNETLERPLDGFSLIAPVIEYMPATRSAAALIEALNKIFDYIDIDVQDLLAHDDMLQEKLKELAEQIQRQKQADSAMAPPPSKNVDSLFT